MPKVLEQRIGLSQTDAANFQTNTRTAVRGILLQEGKILMVKSNQGDYKLPGGGVELKESLKEALVREITEETGLTNCMVKEYFGRIVESHKDVYDPQAVFEMTSNYYQCEWPGTLGRQQLDAYEQEQDFTPVWIDLDEAIFENERVLRNSEKNRWIHRENFVLKWLKTRI